MKNWKFFCLIFLCFLNPSSAQAKIYDCFLFFNELDTLEIRLNELHDSVDYFVLVESVETFRGNFKPLYYEENKERFQKFHEKIIHIVVTERIVTKIPMVVEEYQRNQIMRGLNNCESDDIIFVSDVDEIIRASMIPEIKQWLLVDKKKCLQCEQTLYRFYLNSIDHSSSWTGSCATTYTHLSQDTPHNFREQRRYKYPILQNGGWHFTSMGGPNSVGMKLESFSHIAQDFPENKTIEGIYRHMRNKCTIKPIDSSYPKFILENLSELRDKGLFFEPLVEVETRAKDLMNDKGEKHEEISMANIFYFAVTF